MLKQVTLGGDVIKKKSSKVKCKICRKEFKQITGTHLKVHDITFDEYLKQFPDALLISEDTRQKISDNHADVSGEKNPMYSKHHTKESKQKMSENTRDMSGENNPMYGRTGKDASMYGRTGELAPMYGKTGNKCPMYGRHHTEETKQKQREAHLGKPGTFQGKHHTEESKQKMRDSSPHLSGENNPMYGMSGEKSPSWQGGISFEPYCEKFDDDLKERVREFFGRCCYVCGKNEADNGHKLDVHHVNYDKMVCCNDVKPLFVPLCHSCHGKTLKDRKYWEEFFTVSLEYLTDGKCFLPKKCVTEEK